MKLIPGKLYDVSAFIANKTYFYFIRKTGRYAYGVQLHQPENFAYIGSYTSSLRLRDTPLTEARMKMLMRGIFS